VAKPLRRKIWEIYCIPGLVIFGIKFLSVFAWIFYLPIARVVGLTSQSPGFVEASGIAVIGMLSAGLSIFLWPLIIYWIVSGSYSVGEVLFYPWITAQ
jgi:hypothetical protein